MAGCRTSFGEGVEIGFDEQNLKEVHEASTAGRQACEIDLTATVGA